MWVFGKLKGWWFAWLRGSPPMNDSVMDTIHEEFHVLLYVSGIFLHPKHWILNVVALMFYFIVCLMYQFLLFRTAVRQMDEFITASQTIHMAVLDILALAMLVFLNLHRQNLIGIFRAMSVNFYDYEDDFEIPEMEDEFRKTRKQKLIILAAVPSYLVMTALCCMLSHNIDDLFGMDTDQDFINEVYQKTPVRMWYPFKPQGVLVHYILVFTQAIGANTLAMGIAAADAVIIFLSQTILLQYKILTYRLRKIEECAYHLHRRNGGEELSPTQRLNDASFLECYLKCLSKSVKHHNILNENVIRLQDIILWPAGIAVVSGSFLIAMSLLAIFLGGGRPSILALAAMLIIAEILNMAIICAQSEELKESESSLHEELYGLNWPDTNTKIKRTIFIMIEKSKRPSFLIAGLTPLSWDTFSTIMNSAYTYVNLLIATAKSDK